jgi:glycine betaine catabolism A
MKPLESTVEEQRWTLEPALPGSCYTATSFFERERDAILLREWLCVGRAEEIPQAGDYLLLDVVGEQILVTRTRTGALSAAYNVCRHRGCELALGIAAKPTPDDAPRATGTFPGVIRCPYHSWSYELDGRLRSAPHLNDQIDKAAFALHPVAVDSWGGFLFVNLSPERAATYPLHEQIGAGMAYCRNYPLAELRAAKRIVYDVQANWKVIVENYNECYHCAGVHPELCEVVPAFRQGGGNALDWVNGVPHKDGAFTFTFSGTTTRAPFPGLSADEQVLHKAWLFLPNLMLSLAAEHAAAFTLWPQGPHATRVVCDFLFHPSEIAKPDFDPSDTVDFWDLVNRQDWAVCAGVQRGMRSRSYRQGYFAPMEHDSLDTRRYLTAKLGAQALAAEEGA